MFQAPNRDVYISNENEPSTFLKNRQEHKISNTETYLNHCIGMVVITNSTPTTTKIINGKMFEYYNIFLNAISNIAKTHNAHLIKNLKDGLLYYFPTTIDGTNMKSFVDVLECGLSMIESRDAINQIMTEYHLPPFDFRVSIDYGTASIPSSRSQTKDIFDSTAHICSKINGVAITNLLIIGGDLYHLVRSFKQYEFRIIEECMLGLKINYPVYAVYRKESKIF